MKKIAKLTLVALFILLTYIIILLFIKLYVSWIFDKNVIVLIILTVLLLVISKKVIIHIPKFIISILLYRYPILIIAKVTSWVVTIFYLLELRTRLDVDNSDSIKISILSLILFLSFSRFFLNGIREYVLLKTMTLYTPEEEMKDNFDDGIIKKIFFDYY
jgi:hypothetical protein